MAIDPLPAGCLPQVGYADGEAKAFAASGEAAAHRNRDRACGGGAARWRAPLRARVQ